MPIWLKSLEWQHCDVLKTRTGHIRAPTSLWPSEVNLMSHRHTHTCHQNDSHIADCSPCHYVWWRWWEMIRFDFKHLTVCVNEKHINPVVTDLGVGWRSARGDGVGIRLDAYQDCHVKVSGQARRDIWQAPRGLICVMSWKGGHATLLSYI